LCSLQPSPPWGLIITHIFGWTRRGQKSRNSPLPWGEGGERSEPGVGLLRHVHPSDPTSPCKRPLTRPAPAGESAGSGTPSPQGRRQRPNSLPFSPANGQKISYWFLSTIEKNDWTLSAASTTLKVQLAVEPGARSGVPPRVPVEGTDCTVLTEAKTMVRADQTRPGQRIIA
jgi:hypothetical protein